jgi:hypothetical protein
MEMEIGEAPVLQLMAFVAIPSMYLLANLHRRPI